MPLEAGDVAGEPVDREGGGHRDGGRLHVFEGEGRRNIFETFSFGPFVLMKRKQ
jgi:hypothetical protein